MRKALQQLAMTLSDLRHQYDFDCGPDGEADSDADAALLDALAKGSRREQTRPPTLADELMADHHLRHGHHKGLR